MANLVEKGKGLLVNGVYKFIKTYAPGSSEHLAIEKIDQLVVSMNAFISSYNAFLAHVDTANVAGIGNTNVANFGAAADKIAQTASDQLIPSPKITNI